MIVVDTDVLIDYLCDQPAAVAFLEGSDQLLAASVQFAPRCLCGGV